MRPFVLLLALAGVARADLATDAGRDARGRAPLLRVELDSKPDAKDPSLVEATLRAVVLVAPDGKTLWRRPPPPNWMSTFPADKKLVAAYLRDPRAPLEAMGFPFSFTLTRADTIVVIGGEQLTVFARADGKVVFHELAGEIGFGALRYQHADATVECGERRVTRHVGATFVIDCGSRLVYDFGQGIHVFKTDPWGRAGTTMFPDVTAAKPQYEFPLDGARLVLKPTD